jgi:hypothetical protein
MTTQSGRVVPFQTYAARMGSSGFGLANQDKLTQAPIGGRSFMSIPSNGVSADDVDGLDVVPQVNYLWYILAIFLLLVALKYASQHERSGMQPAIAGIGVYNYIVIGIMSMLFIITAKVILNKYQVKGLTTLVNMV